jgi:hypothetical protein
MIRATALLVSLSCVRIAAAHHGGGTFDNRRQIELTGTLTRLELINPHSWIYFDVTGEDGKVRSYRCEMRAATVLRRSGWTKEMFRIGQRIAIQGSPDRNDPNSCYLNTIILEDGRRADRYGQFTKPAVSAGGRAARRPNGDPNIAGDWAPEQLVMTDPRGRGGALVPLSTVEQYKPGEGRIALPAPERGRGGALRIRGAELTEAGTNAVASFDMFAVKDNPRMRCETTSIIFDWTFDGPVNRITQNDKTIVLQYGQLGFTRTIHMDQARHPAGIKPSRSGHSIGRWEDDVLIVDTVGFTPGVLSPPVPNSDTLHVVERFSLDPRTMTLTRSYAAEDPVYFTGQYTGSDTVQVADIPYGPDPCDEKGFIDYSKEGQKAGGARKSP